MQSGPTLQRKCGVAHCVQGCRGGRQTRPSCCCSMGIQRLHWHAVQVACACRRASGTACDAPDLHWGAERHLWKVCKEATPSSSTEQTQQWGVSAIASRSGGTRLEAASWFSSTPRLVMRCCRGSIGRHPGTSRHDQLLFPCHSCLCSTNSLRDPGEPRSWPETPCPARTPVSLLGPAAPRPHVLQHMRGD